MEVFHLTVIMKIVLIEEILNNICNLFFFTNMIMTSMMIKTLFVALLDAFCSHWSHI